MRVKVMADYGCNPVWDEDDFEELILEDMTISPGLRDRFVDWAASYDAILDWNDPRNSGFESDAEEAAFEAEGRALAAALGAELGPTAIVRYWKD